MSRGQKLLWYGAAVCAVAGMLCARVPGLRFSALLCWCGCAALLIFAVLCRLAQTRPWAKRMKRVCLILFCGGVLFFAGLEAAILSGAGGDTDGEPVSCVIVLGAGVNGTEASAVLQSRLEATLAYLADKPDIPVIVSGSQGQGELITEAECMYRYLTARGVEESRVWKEEQATSTRTNFQRSYELMAQRGIDPAKPFAFVTSSFHVFRSRLLAGVPGARGVAARLPDDAYYNTLTFNFYVREAFALANELLFRMDLDI